MITLRVRLVVSQPFFLKNLVLESVDDGRCLARYSCLYKIQNGLVDIDKATYMGTKIQCPLVEEDLS